MGRDRTKMDMKILVGCISIQLLSQRMSRLLTQIAHIPNGYLQWWRITTAHCSVGLYRATTTEKPSGEETKLVRGLPVYKVTFMFIILLLCFMEFKKVKWAIHSVCPHCEAHSATYHFILTNLHVICMTILFAPFHIHYKACQRIWNTLEILVDYGSWHTF